MRRVWGCRNSGLLWLFWLVYLLCSLPRLYSQVRRELRSEEGDLTETLSNCLTLLLAIAQWILAFFMDVPPAHTDDKEGTFHIENIENF